MVIIRIILSCFLALVLITGTAVFIFFQVFDTDQYLPKVTEKASAAVGRPVSIGHLSLGLSTQGFTLDAGPVIIDDDPAFTQQPFIKIDRIRVSFNLGLLLVQHKMHVTGLLLQYPQIHFIRSQEGFLNVQSLGKAKASKVKTVPAAVSVTAVSPLKIPAVLPKMKISPAVETSDIFSNMDIRIQDGAVSFIDQSQAVPLDIWLNGINARLNGLSLSAPFRLSLEASLYSKEPNVQGNALVSWDASKHVATVSSLGLHIDWAGLDFGRIQGISPNMRDPSMLENITGALQLNMSSLELGAPGDFKANGQLTISNGLIKHLNIVHEVLSHTLGNFGVEINMDRLFKGPLKDKLNAPDTVIEKALAQFAVHDKTVFIDNSTVKTNIFEFSAKGSVDVGMNLDMQTVFYFNDDISAGLVEQLDGFKYLMDDSKRISIDASLQGVIPHLKYKPSKAFRKKSKKALMQEGGRILGILF
jgi:hypothetical protein